MNRGSDTGAGPSVIVAGGRDFDDYDFLQQALDRLLLPGAVIVSGGAPGADLLGERYAEERGLALERFPADWHKLGRAAGPLRNEKMAEFADVLAAFWNGKSRGTGHMIKIALARGLEVHVYRYDPQPGAKQGRE